MKLVVRKKVASSIDSVASGRIARAARIKARLSLRRVATAMGYSAPYVSDLEKGRRSWNTDLWSRYEAAITGLSNTSTNSRRRSLNNGT